MASLAGTTLVYRGTRLDHMWALNPRAYQQLAPLGANAGIPLLIVACALAAAGVGWFKRRRWAWWLAVAILGTQILGDFVNLFAGRLLEGTVGCHCGRGSTLLPLKSTRSGLIPGLITWRYGVSRAKEQREAAERKYQRLAEGE